VRLASVLTRASLACLVLALGAGGASAHKVNVFAYAEGDKVYTQAYFNDGRPAVGSTIEVYDASNRLLLKGKTDDAGEFAFPVPAKADLKIVLVASMGHKNEFLLPASDLPDASKPAPARQVPSQAAKAAPPAAGAAPAKAPPQAAAAPEASTPQLSEERLRVLIDEALQARLAPLTKMIARLNEEQHVSVSEVVAGIGYIFGLAGLAAYFASRKRAK
jgi:nickel transport protein